MKNTNDNVEKICNFYISDWHLLVMVLPYINKDIENGKSIITFLQNSLEDNMEILLSKLNLKDESNKKIKQIDWKNYNIINYEEIEKRLNKKTKDKVILISGKKDYVEDVKKNIEKYININKNQAVKIIDCYEIDKNTNDIREIVNTYNKILNTTGEKNVDELKRIV